MHIYRVCLKKIEYSFNKLLICNSSFLNKNIEKNKRLSCIHFIVYNAILLGPVIQYLVKNSSQNNILLKVKEIIEMFKYCYNSLLN